ncbi:caspase-1-like [Penaeus japonicus]|uniref:caspase-1-like n=1 Tax=Penaeus japonicus TaxID=27405 RepID=UPI001C70F4F2|nr:caspase-1-like [Penaeus japonicus]XP_042890411.1 caspase-1-like [Penaeus japonicus]
MALGREDPFYNMSHQERGHALIFAYEDFCAQGPSRRGFAKHDVDICSKAFRKLEFEVRIHWNLTKKMLLQTIMLESREDHSNRDCLVVVLMTHGGITEKGEEVVWTCDFEIRSSELWKYFKREKCPSLAGKPKLFFIQACRGENVDKGVCLRRPAGMRLQYDGMSRENEYDMPLDADVLIMWASYPGMYAFVSSSNYINGSVFLHFLSKVLIEYGDNEDLATMLLRVTREVAVSYESYVPEDDKINKNKQIPYTVSTLMRKLVFFCPKYK